MVSTNENMRLIEHWEREDAERKLQEEILNQRNVIFIALQYLKAGQVELATMVLEGMQP